MTPPPPPTRARSVLTNPIQSNPTQQTRYRPVTSLTWLDEELEFEPELRLRPRRSLPLPLPLPLPELEEEDDRPRRLPPPLRLLLRLRERLRDLRIILLLSFRVVIHRYSGQQLTLFRRDS